MNDDKNKVKAFTLSEMLVVILITVIVVGLAFSILNLVQKQMRSVRENFDSKTEAYLLKQALWRDLNTFSRAYYLKHENMLACQNAQNQITYHFYDKFVIRDNIDTFNVTIKIKKPLFLGKPQSDGELDAIELILADTTRAPIMIYKINSTESFMD
tara:strand:- start:1909 stop:2376 length:468 start_codon:yes stop_codon:yes gene_type:complete